MYVAYGYDERNTVRPLSKKQVPRNTLPNATLQMRCNVTKQSRPFLTVSRIVCVRTSTLPPLAQVLLARIAQSGSPCGAPQTLPNPSPRILLEGPASKHMGSEPPLSFHAAALQISVMGARNVQSAIALWAGEVRSRNSTYHATAHAALCGLWRVQGDHGRALQHCLAALSLASTLATWNGKDVRVAAATNDLAGGCRVARTVVLVLQNAKSFSMNILPSVFMSIFAFSCLHIDFCTESSSTALMFPTVHLVGGSLRAKMLDSMCRICSRPT